MDGEKLDEAASTLKATVYGEMQGNHQRPKEKAGRRN